VRWRIFRCDERVERNVGPREPDRVIERPARNGVHGLASIERYQRHGADDARP
jgi:hypothetical protein